MTRQARIFFLALLLPVAALARDPGGVFQVNEDPSSGGASPSASMDDDGSFIVSWVSGGYDVEARRYDPAGAPLGGQFEAGRVTATYSGSTATTLDRSGFLVVWGNEPKFSGGYNLGQRFDREGHPLLSEPVSTAGSYDPDVASTPQGSSVTVGYGGNGITATRFDALGRQAGGVIQVSGRGLFPEVTVDASGNFVVAWQGDRGLFIRRFSANGSPRGGAVKVTSNVAPPALAGNRQGRFVVAWRAGSSLWARLYSASGEPRTQPVRVSDAVVQSTSVSAAMDAEGKVLVTWSCCATSSSFSSALYGRWLESTGAPSGGPFRISPDSFAFAPAAASGPANRFLVVWQDAHPDPFSAPNVILGRRLAFARPGDDPCLLRRGSFVCDTAHDGGEEELLVPFRGPGSDVPLLGDLDGDGDDDPCRYRPGRFLCDVAHDGGTPELEIAFGLPGDIPLLGDLDGEGKDDACVYRGSQLLCDTAHNGGTAEVIVSFNPFGHPLVLPFLADVDGDGDDDPCLARNGQLLCDREHDGGPEDLAIPVDFGAEGDVLLLGDVNNDNRADPCVHRDGRFRCDTRRDGSADLIIPFHFRGAVPLLGNVDGL